MIVIAMQTMGLPLQEAVDFVGDMCSQSVRRFLDAKARLPSFDQGGPIDRDVAKYVKGLEDWMVGALNWSFASARYFRTNGRVVRKTRSVDLLPKVKGH